MAHALEHSELSALCSRLWAHDCDEAEIPTAVRALRLILLLGGQRPTCVLSASLSDVDFGSRLLWLVDRKHVRPYDHVLPILPLAERELQALKIRSLELETLELFPSRTNRAAAMRAELVSHALAKISKDLLAAGITSKPMQIYDLRATAKAMFSSLGVTREVGFHVMHGGPNLWSIKRPHGASHWIAEKRDALSKWETFLQRLLTGASAAPQRA